MPPLTGGKLINLSAAGYAKLLYLRTRYNEKKSGVPPQAMPPLTGGKLINLYAAGYANLLYLRTRYNEKKSGVPPQAMPHNERKVAV